MFVCMKFRKIAILGTGLLGASFAYAAKSCGLCQKVSAWSRSQSTRDKCMRRPEIFDEVYPTAAEAAADADLIVICTPTENIPAVAAEIAPALKKGALVTDVGSVKTEICRACAEVVNPTGARFVGSHPMAGSEKIGIDFADEKLFDFRPCFITPVDGGDSAAAKVLLKAWKALGMRVYVVSPDLHDAIVARISHLPHLAAVLICSVVSDFGINLLPYTGQGFRDTTRVASGSVQIWESIVADNRAEILSTLTEFSEKLGSLIEAIKADDKPAVAEILKKAKSFRDKL